MPSTRVATLIAFMICSTGYSQEFDLSLLRAVENGPTTEVEALLEAGANANAKADNGVTALMRAATHGYTEVVRVLLEAGAKVNARDKAGTTALILAAREGKTEAAQALLDSGAKVNAKGERRRTALIVAARAGHYGTVITLLAAGADVNAEDKNGSTALMTAQASGHTVIADFLEVYTTYVNGGSGSDTYSNLLRRYCNVLRVVETQYVKEVEPRDLVHASIRGMLSKVDTDSSFLPGRAHLQLEVYQNDENRGIGLRLRVVEGIPMVTSSYEGGSAHRFGIRAGDKILRIDGAESLGMTSNEVNRRLRGPEGSKVNISITRPGYESPIDFTLPRLEVEWRPSVPYAFILPGGFGYLRILEFTEATGSEVDRHLERLRQKGMNSLILDLRENQGGVVDHVVAVSNKFLKKGTKIVTTRGRTQGSDQELFAARASAYSELPLVVLVSRTTASGAEIVAGAIQDHDRGLIVGENTFGSGKIQSIYRVSDGNGLALTTAMFFTPSGRRIQRDYSDSFDDYHSSARREKGPAPKGKLKRTAAGREVPSGVGIEPDIHVASPTLPRSLRYLLSVQAFSRYAARFAPEDGRRPASPMGASEIATPMHVRLIDQNFEMGEEALGDFFDFLERDGINFSSEELLQHRDSLATLIKLWIFTTLWGEEAGVRATIEEDPQVQRALEAISEAAKLSGMNR